MLPLDRLLDAVRALAPLIRAHADEAEQQRRLPQPVVTALADAGLFRLYTPHTLGGWEVEPLTFYRVVEALARIDASTAWCVWLASGNPVYVGRSLPDPGAAVVFGRDPQVVTAGVVAPYGRAVVHDGGYVVSGHWPYASGCQHSTWLFCCCTVYDGAQLRLTAPGDRGVFAIIAFYVQIGPLLAGGGSGTGEALASLLLVLKIGIFDWILFNFSSIATAAFDTFLQWGLSPAGVQLSAGTFQQPSVIVDLGFTAAKPLRLFAERLVGWSAMWNFWTMASYVMAWWEVVIAFMFVALHLMMTLIEYHMAVLVGTVLVPWGVLQPTAFFTEFAIGWITGGLVRILVTGAMVGIAVPLFDLVMVNTTAGGDPTFYSAMITGITSLVFAILSWVVPGRAAAIAGRGVSLAVHGGALLAGAAGPLRGVIMVQQVIRGISQMLRR